MVSDCEHLEIEATDVDNLSSWARSNQIDLTIVGPEAPLAAGIVDHFEKVGLPIFGPQAKAARIESSKAYAKELMRNAGIPTAEHRTFTDLSTAEAWILRQGAPTVVKASGLAAGKGAVVCTTEQEALSAVRSMLGDFIFGEAGREVVIEEFLEGEELSVFALTDGEHSVILQPSQDHKRVGEGDTGPNTGGMGAYAPVSIATPELMAEVGSKIIQPTLRALAEDGSPFQGLLYAGLIKTESGLQVIEFNCRFGDPETQVVLPLMQDSLLDLIVTVAEGGRLQPGVAAARPDVAVTTVVASRGYPSSYEKSKEVTIPRQLESENCIVFHAGTMRREGQLLTSGGRVLAVTALAPSISEAAEASADAAGQIEFEGAFHRSDIGWRERLRQD
jgi:phosphoribosylamine--glycine ligase